MNGCIYRTADNQCEKFSDPVRNTLSWCVGDEPCEARKISNADKIRAMSDEELAMWINDITTNALSVLALGSDKQTKTIFYWFNWLKKEA